MPQRDKRKEEKHVHPNMNETDAHAGGLISEWYPNQLGRAPRKLSPSVIGRMQKYPRPGNIRGIERRMHSDSPRALRRNACSTHVWTALRIKACAIAMRKLMVLPPARESQDPYEVLGLIETTSFEKRLRRLAVANLTELDISSLAKALHVTPRTLARRFFDELTPHLENGSRNNVWKPPGFCWSPPAWAFQRSAIELDIRTRSSEPQAEGSRS
jgi:hypothetical protein